MDLELELLTIGCSGRRRRRGMVRGLAGYEAVEVKEGGEAAGESWLRVVIPV